MDSSVNSTICLHALVWLVWVEATSADDFQFPVCVSLSVSPRVVIVTEHIIFHLILPPPHKYSYNHNMTGVVYDPRYSYLKLDVSPKWQGYLIFKVWGLSLPVGRHICWKPWTVHISRFFSVYSFSYIATYSYSCDDGFVCGDLCSE